MADSNITKKALANALKELMKTKSFEKISISDICEKCDMNRKSFYYHFKDKYDLINWIFDTEFIAVARSKSYSDVWASILDIATFFYDNQTFYRKALYIKGQNSFSEHFRNYLIPVIFERIKDALGDEAVAEFQVNFLTDAFFMAFYRWISKNNMMPPEKFIEQLKLSVKYIHTRYKEVL